MKNQGARISRRISTGYPYKVFQLLRASLREGGSKEGRLATYIGRSLRLIGRVITVLWSFSQIHRPLSKLNKLERLFKKACMA